MIKISTLVYFPMLKWHKPLNYFFMEDNSASSYFIKLKCVDGPLTSKVTASKVQALTNCPGVFHFHYQEGWNLYIYSWHEAWTITDQHRSYVRHLFSGLSEWCLRVCFLTAAESGFSQWENTSQMWQFPPGCDLAQQQTENHPLCKWHSGFRCHT